MRTLRQVVVGIALLSFILLGGLAAVVVAGCCIGYQGFMDDTVELFCG